MVCLQCGELSLEDPYAFRCPNADSQTGTLHAVAPRGHYSIPQDHEEDQPFVRFREGLASYHFARHHGLSDEDYVELVRNLDERIASVAGRGFRFTPLVCSEDLAHDLALAEGAAVWIKDETQGVADSHKARHLMGIAIQLEVAARLGFEPARKPDLAIASCGNAALAAAVLAKAMRRTLDVFVPTWAAQDVVDRLHELGARIVSCDRMPGSKGDPCMSRFKDAVQQGSIPFTVQGSMNCFTLDGGKTLLWELETQQRRSGPEQFTMTSVQVGGGALATALAMNLRRNGKGGFYRPLGMFHCVQTAGAHPLERAWSRVAEGVRNRLGVAQAGTPREEANRMRAYSGERIEELLNAAKNPDRYMWPWESEPHSIATGILDDETYDWYDLLHEMTFSGGRPIVVDDSTIAKATQRAHELTGICVSPTGASGLAGLYALADAGELCDGELFARGSPLVLFTGVR